MSRPPPTKLLTSILGLALLLSGTACGGGGGGSSTASANNSPPSSTGSQSGTQAPASPPANGEVFALADPGDTAATFQSYLNKAVVSGLAYRALWSQIEPSGGAYQWASLDNALNAAQANSKKITIHIGASGGAWPVWLIAAGMQTYTGTTPFDTITDPVPWDAVFISHYTAFMQAMSQHIQQRNQMGYVRAVSVGAPVSEMSLVACYNGALGSTTSVTYDRAHYLNAWMSTASALAAAFPQPKVFVSAPVTTICRTDTDGKQFYSDLLTPLSASYANLSIFAADLNATGSLRLTQAGSFIQSLPIGLQTIWSATNDPSNRMGGTLSSAICAGRTAGARYFEIYKRDLDSTNPAIQTAVEQALGATACP